MTDPKQSDPNQSTPDTLPDVEEADERNGEPGTADDDEDASEGAEDRVVDVVDPGARLVDMDGAQQILGMGPHAVMGLVADGSLAPAPAPGEDLMFRLGEVEVVRDERLSTGT